MRVTGRERADRQVHHSTSIICSTCAPPPLSRALRHRPIILHPFFRRAPLGGITCLQNPASCDHVWERGNQVFGERTRATAGGDYFPNDVFFPDVGNLSINDMGDNGASGSTPAAPYVICSSLFEIMLYVLFLLCVVDVISLSTVVVDRMASLICFIFAMDCLSISWIKSYAKLLIYSTLCYWFFFARTLKESCGTVAII